MILYLFLMHVPSNDITLNDALSIINCTHHIRNHYSWQEMQRVPSNLITEHGSTKFLRNVGMRLPHYNAVRITQNIEFWTNQMSSADPKPRTTPTVTERAGVAVNTSRIVILRCSVRISAGILAILTGVSFSFPQPLQAYN
jgi:hypothetical protein